MKTEQILRVIADNVEQGKHLYEGLLFNGKSCGDWSYITSIIDNPEFFTLAPKTHIINGFEVPAPMSERPEKDGIYFVSVPSYAAWCVDVKWYNDMYDNQNFERGLYFSTREAAIANSKAMIKVNPYE